MPAPDPILSLIERFEFHRQAYILGKYNETQLRREFVDKFFSALGWDVDNNKGFSEKYKEVLHEEPVRIRGTTLFFDYTFRIGGARKFIVETKKPSVRIKDAAEAALQLRRYAWNQKLPLSILTNFEEFAIYDCRIKPENGDAASKARIEYFTYKEYPEKWDWLISIIAPDSILRGSFDKYAETTKGKRGTATVDDDILAEIEQWRDALAKNIALRNASLTVEELNSVVQRTIDRILFLRICEDRGIEEYETLHKLLEGEQVYGRICQLFRYADDKYNSGLFHFQQEPDWDESPDTLSLTIAIDDKVLKEIIKRLYFPNSQYEFSLIPPAILGHVYEQFLGKVIRLTEGHQAKVEYKPEVKKAGGVFYTPQYIVEYIVKHTVGELVKDKTPREVSKLRILDPACGSGSFLIGAYQYLLDWHRDWYIANLVPVFKEKNSVTDPAVQVLLPEQAPKKKKSAATIDLPIYNPGNGKEVRLSERVRSDWKLTTAEKKRVLLNNIFGVDIDQQAVEVTKLSLLLKVLEEENQETVSKQLTITAERALPSLDHNIKCGNSLIGWDILTPEMPADEVKRINPFDWSKEFEPVMAAGGFDAVIGNPPYVRQETLGTVFKDYAKEHYETYAGTADIFTYFIEKGISLLRSKGLFSYIVANKWMRANYGRPLRQFLKAKQIVEIIDFGDLPIFKGATTYPCIIRVSKGDVDGLISVTIADTLEFPSLDDYISQRERKLNKSDLNDDGWSLAEEKQTLLLTRLLKKCVSLDDYIKGNVFRGILTGLNEAFIIDDTIRNQLITAEPTCAEIIKPFLSGKDVKRYQNLRAKKFLIFTKRGIDIKKYPVIENYLKQFKNQLIPKPSDWRGENWQGRKPGNYQWYEIQDSVEYYLEFEKSKIIYPEVCKQPEFSLEESKLYPNKTCFIMPGNDKYLLGLLNSRLNFFFFQTILPKLRGGFFLPSYISLKKIPIRTINFSDPADVARHDRIVTLVTQMLDLNRKLQDARLEQERTMLYRQIEATDASIDKLVYELYELTEEEIKVVEGR
jgi:type I restriction-modification system DNA methylase subunit